MRPVLRHLIPYKALDSIEYDLFDFVFLNEALDVEGENQRRANEHAASKRQREKR